MIDTGFSFFILEVATPPTPFPKKMDPPRRMTRATLRETDDYAQAVANDVEQVEDGDYEQPDVSSITEDTQAFMSLQQAQDRRAQLIAQKTAARKAVADLTRGSTTLLPPTHVSSCSFACKNCN